MKKLLDWKDSTYRTPLILKGVRQVGKTWVLNLKKFKEPFPDKVKLRARFSLDNLKLDDDVLNIPLFMADQADRLIGAALEQYEEKSPYQIIIL